MPFPEDFMHRYRVSFLVLGLLVGWTARAAAQDDPKEIIKKAIAAHGGAEKLDKFKGSKNSSKGTISIMGLELEFTSDTVSMYPAKQKSTIKMDVMGNAITVVQLIVGDKMSVTLNGMAQEVPDAQKSELKQSIEMQRVMNLTPLLAEKGFEMKSLGDTKVNGKEVVGVSVSSKNLKETKMYFDKSTNLLTKVERMGADPTGGGGEVKQEMFLSDYKDVQGLKKPMKVTMMNDGKKFMDSTVTKQEVLEKVDDKEFAD